MAYLYIWTHLPTGKFYIGSRTAAGCHLNDGYICSSDFVKEDIELNPKNWIRTIIAEGKSNDIETLEKKILDLLNVIDNKMCLNQTNFNGKIVFKTLNVSRTQPLKYDKGNKNV